MAGNGGTSFFMESFSPLWGDLYKGDRQMRTKLILAWGAGVLALVLVTAGASALVTKEVMSERHAIETTQAPSQKSQKITWNEPRQAQPVRTAAAAPPCSDGNIVGLALGGIGGGIAGNQIGKGSGNTVATIGGAVGGAYLGKEFIPTENVTCAR